MHGHMNIKSRGTFCLAVNCILYGVHRISSTVGCVPWLYVEWAKLGLLSLPNCLCHKLVVLELHYAMPVTPLSVNVHFMSLKKSRYRHGKPLGFQLVEDPRISRQSAHEGGNVVSPRHRPPLPLRRDPWYSSPLQAASTPGPECGRQE